MRLRNVFASGMKNTQGAIPGGAQRADEVLAALPVHPLWRDRDKRKREYEAAHPGKRYGVGFGCVQKDFGTGAEAAFAEVEFIARGSICCCVTSASTWAPAWRPGSRRCASRGSASPPTRCAPARPQWPELPMITTGDPYLMQQAEQDSNVGNPRWTPNLVSPQQREQLGVLLRARHARGGARCCSRRACGQRRMSIWSQGIGGGQLAPLVVRREDARWVDGKLTAGGLNALPLEQLVAKAHELGLVTGAIVHTFNRWQWARGRLPARRRRCAAAARRDRTALGRRAAPTARARPRPTATA